MNDHMHSEQHYHRFPQDRDFVHYESSEPDKGPQISLRGMALLVCFAIFFLIVAMLNSGCGFGGTSKTEDARMKAAQAQHFREMNAGADVAIRRFNSHPFVK